VVALEFDVDVVLVQLVEHHLVLLLIVDTVQVHFVTQVLLEAETALRLHQPLHQDVDFDGLRYLLVNFDFTFIGIALAQTVDEHDGFVLEK